jgi:DNA modification methylase
MIDLRKGDCLELMKDIPDNSVDLVIIDPPYEINANGSGGAFGKEKRGYHSEVKALSDGITNLVLDELVRIMKKINIYIWCNKNQLRQYIDYFEGIGATTDLLTWHKTNPVPTCNNKYLSDTEYLLYFRKNGVPMYGTYATKKKYYVTPTNKEDKKLYKHPTIKPLDIMENLIINSSQENDVILDCFMGSGTTGVACKKLNRNFIGMELDETYFEIAKKRISEEEPNQTTIFDYEVK